MFLGYKILEMATSNHLNLTCHHRKPDTNQNSEKICNLQSDLLIDSKKNRYESILPSQYI